MSAKHRTVLIAESGSGFGGSAKYLSDLLGTFPKGMFAIEVLAYGRGPLFERIEPLGIPIKYTPLLRFPWFEKRLDPFESEKANSWRYGLSLLAAVVQLGLLVPIATLWLFSKGVRVVHLNNEIRSHLPLLLAARLSGCKVLCHLHGWRHLTRLEQAAAGLVHLYVGITHPGTRFYQKEFPKGRYVTIVNGLLLPPPKEDISERLAIRRQLGLEETAICVGMIGRLVHWKGQEIFLEAFQRVLKQDSRAYALVVGGSFDQNGAYLKTLQGHAERLGILGKIHFTGWQKDINPYLAAMDIVVHASVNPEPFGLVIAEAMAQGKPVIASDGGGVSELIRDHQTGLLVPPKDPVRLSEAILELIRSSELAARWGKAGRAHILKEFDIRQNSRKVARIYRALLGDAKLLRPRILTTYPIPQSPIWQKATVLVEPRPNGTSHSFKRVGLRDRTLPWRLLKARKNFDVLVTGSEREDCLFALLQQILPGRKIPHIMTCCLWKSERNPLRRWMKKELLRAMARSVTLFLVWSRRECESYSRHFGIPGEKFVFLPHHTSLQGYDVESRAGDYIFAGGDSSRDYETLLKAVAMLPVQTVIVARQIASWDGKGLPSNVTVKATDPIEFRQLMAGSRMVVLPFSGGLLQSTGQQTYLNAMLLKKPVIVSEVPGIFDHMTPEVTGIVVPPEDPEALREAISRVLAGGPRIEKMVEAAYRRVQKEFTLDHFVKRMIAQAAKVSENGKESF